LIYATDGDYDPLTIPTDKMLVAYRISQQDIDIPEEELENYIVGLWF